MIAEAYSGERFAMGRSDEGPRVLGTSARMEWQLSNFLGRALALAAGTVVVVAAFAASLALIAVAFAAGLLAWGYVWWRTRALRRTLRERAAANAADYGDQAAEARGPVGGRVIEGHAIREEGPGKDSSAAR